MVSTNGFKIPQRNDSVATAEVSEMDGEGRRVSLNNATPPKQKTMSLRMNRLGDSFLSHLPANEPKRISIVATFYSVCLLCPSLRDVLT